jgi:sugar/nucleoside kinase (ribokinase family)
MGNQPSPIKIAGHKVEAIDTNGAGDLFAGSFLHGLCQGFSLQQAGQLASFASAQLVTEFSPRLGKTNLDKVRDYMNNLAN